MSEPRPWALILGASSGFGEATARAFAREGYGILGVHLDRRSALPRVQRLVEDLREHAPSVHFINRNAADDEQRAQALEAIAAAVGDGTVRVVVHSLAFGSLLPLVTAPGSADKVTTRRQLQMTLDVMAHSLVFWVRDLVERELLVRGGRVFGMTSIGGYQAWDSYGAVAAAKAALEAYIRQLTLELAPRGITANAILAGVCETPALARIPQAEGIKARALAKNPHDRLTRPEDVAACIVELARPGTYWMTGNIIAVDGGEDACA